MFNLTRAAVFLALAFLASALHADPAVAIRDARGALEARRYDQAVKILRDAVPDAQKLAEPQRTQALAALHFYSALALSAKQDASAAAGELNQFFDLSPGTNTIDPAKFDPAFVKLFTTTLASRQAANTSAFQLAYPTYASYASLMPAESSTSDWGEGPEMTALATSKERQQWRALKDDASRREFIDAFWIARDVTPGTEVNERRAEFLRRVAFADATFGDATHRGALTDRGRVFLLLGAPPVVRQLPLSARTGGSNIRSGTVTGSHADDGFSNWRSIEASDKNQSMAAQANAPAEKGKVERWVYGAQFLPVKIPEDSVTFTFITEEGYGENVLQREPLVNRVLLEAAGK